MTVAHDRLEAPEGVAEIAERVARDQGFVISALGIVLTDRDSVRNLNKTHLDRSYETDVLAFDLRDDSADQRTVEGEIYVDLDTAFERAPEFGAVYEQEVRRYVVHGLLHLMGYRDDDPARKDEMNSLENLYLGFTGN